MKFTFQPIIILIIIGVAIISGCSSSKKLQPTIPIQDTTFRDTLYVSPKPVTTDDSLKVSYNFLKVLKRNEIDFKTFSSKAKVQFEDKNGRQPDANAIIRMQKDSTIWISVSSTFLNIEVVRILITPDTLIIINKLEKSVESHPYKYIQGIVQLPLTFSMVQDIFIGNPVFINDSIISSSITEGKILIETADKFVKNLLTISTEKNLLLSSKITNDFNGLIRTASLEYADYSTIGQHLFATYRALKVDNESKIDLRMALREVEFNNELSFPFTVPGNYKIK